MLRKTLFLLLALSAPAFGQGVIQSGSVTPDHIALWTTNGVIQDGGTSSYSPLSSLGITSSASGSMCINTAAITGPYVAFCLGANPTAGNAALSVTAYGSATALPLEITVNGTTVLTVSTTGLLTYPSIPTSAPTTHCALWDNGGSVDITTCP